MNTMKFTFTIESSLGHTVQTQTDETSFTQLQDRFEYAIMVFKNWELKDLGETEYLNIEFKACKMSPIESEHFNTLNNYFNLQLEDD